MRNEELATFARKQTSFKVPWDGRDKTPPAMKGPVIGGHGYGDEAVKLQSYSWGFL